MTAGVATPYLDLLARVLATEGWTVRPRYDQTPALLHLLCPSLPTIGESVAVKTGEGGIPWFVASTGDPLAPCHDLLGAVATIGARITPHAMAATVRRATDIERRDAPTRCPISRVRTWLKRT